MLLTDEERPRLLEALDIVRQSQPLFEEFENANYHSAWEFLQEITEYVRDGEDIGYDEEDFEL